MNKTNYKQYDTRWAKLPYKDNPDNIGNNGCGEVAVCNSIIEMLSQMNQTPKTMQPYCRQFACHDGTYWSGIPTMLKHYGCTEVIEHQTMASLWKELAKGDRVAIYMMNSRPGGSKGIHWTSGGHFVCSVAYKKENGLHKVYVKDSNSTSSDRNGWISYEENMRGDVSACWSGKLNGSPAPTPTTKIKMIDVSDFQSNINWSKVKADGVKAVIIRCGGRGGEKGNIYEDTDFFANIKGAYKAGLAVGIYFLTQAINAKEGKAEAQYTIKRWTESGIPISFPICIDSEDVTWKNPDGTTGYGRAHSKTLSKAKRTEAIKGFADECKRQGYKSMVYASTSYLEDHIDMSVLAPLMDVWVAQYYKTCQYKGKYIIWQYTSEGSVSGIKGNVDMDWCYVEPNKVDPPKPEPKPEPTPSGGTYTGAYPTEAEIKTASNKGIINNTIAWAKDIAKQGFKYLLPMSAGCYFCGTTKKKAYTCMPYVTAMFAHGGADPDVLGLCKTKHSLSLRDDDVDWKMLIKKGKFKYLGRMSSLNWSDIKAGDVLVQYASDDNHGHMMLYCGNNQLAEALPEGCKITSGAKSRFERYKKGESQTGEGKKNFVMRYIGTRNYLEKGDEGTAVLKWQDYLNWWSDGAFYKECGKGDTYFGSNTHKWTVKFQTAVFGAKEADGTVGQKTIAKAKEVRK